MNMQRAVVDELCSCESGSYWEPPAQDPWCVVHADLEWIIGRYGEGGARDLIERTGP